MSENNFKIDTIVFMVGLFVAIAGIYYLGPSITGLVVKESGHADNLNLIVISNGNYTWQLQNAGDLKSLKLYGRVTNYGKARAFLESNGEKYLIFDSTRLNDTAQTSNTSNQSNLITVFAVKEDNQGNNKTLSDKDSQKSNKKPEWTSGIKQFIINGTTTINLSQHFTDKDNNPLIYLASQVDGISTFINNELAIISSISNYSFNTTITFTANDGIDSKSHTVSLIIIVENQSMNIASITNETKINQTINQTISGTINETQANQTQNLTQPFNRSITISLAYNSGTVYDANDNGEESVNGIVDMTLEGTKFSWDADQSRLCTRWEVYNKYENTLTRFCNGNSDCCAFANLLPTKSNWGGVYYSGYGKDGSGYDNIVSAQVIYYDVNLSAQNPKSEIYYSAWNNLSVKFFAEETEFSGICIDTCSLSGLNKSSYNILFEVEGDAVLKIDKIAYSVIADVQNKAPILQQNFTTINISRNKYSKINLSQYFSDPDGDNLQYGYYNPGNLTMLFENNTAIIIPDKNFEGRMFTFLTANDSQYSAVSNVFDINVLPAKYNFPNINLSLGSFEIRDKNDTRLAAFDGFGNLNIKGNLMQNAALSADSDDFAISNSTSGLNAVITNPEGNILLKGTVSQNLGMLNATPNSFIIQDKNGTVVAYFNSNGDLFLKGTFLDNVEFG